MKRFLTIMGVLCVLAWSAAVVTDGFSFTGGSYNTQSKSHIKAETGTFTALYSESVAGTTGTFTGLFHVFKDAGTTGIPTMEVGNSEVKFAALWSIYKEAGTCSDSGNGNAGAITLTPTSSYIEITCEDSDGCDVTMDESGLDVENHGIKVEVLNVSANDVNFPDSDGVCEVAAGGTVTISQWETAFLRYTGETWVASRDRLTLKAGTLSMSSGSIIDSSGSISFGDENLSTTGALHGKIEIIADDNSLSAAQCYGSLNKLNGAESTTLPAAVAGMNTMQYSDDATVKTIAPNGTDHIWLNGVDNGAGNSINSSGAVGDYIVLVAFSDGNWYSIGQSGTWIDTP